MTEGGIPPVVDGGVADLQLDYETTETTRSLGSKSNTQILGDDNHHADHQGNHNDYRYGFMIKPPPGKRYAPESSLPWSRVCKAHQPD